MKYITSASAWCNGDVAYIAWRCEKPIDKCLGFMVTRIMKSDGSRRILPTWVAFTDQSNPSWNAQDSSVWPIQSFQWRDLTLRKFRDTTQVRDIDFEVSYEVVPVTDDRNLGAPIPPSPTAPTQIDGAPAFEGPRRQLYAMGDPAKTNFIEVTNSFGDVKAAFNNGILSTQNLLKQLESVGKASPSKMAKAHAKSATAATAQQKSEETHYLSVLKQEIVKPASPIREYLAGDLLRFLPELLERAEKINGDVYLALYELHDEELIALLEKHMEAGRICIILTTAGSTDPNPKGTPKDQKKPIVWDTENDPARARLKAAEQRLAQKLKLKALPQPRVIDRMFNSSARIGHNKFAVLVDDHAKPKAVLSGSTNWTENGLCAQSNNAIIVENEDIAGDYLAYWIRLSEDPTVERVPLTVKDVKGKTIVGAESGGRAQSQALRTANGAGAPERRLQIGSGRLWASPNTKAVTVPATKPTMPPDLEEVYALMRGAKQAIFFLTFLPGLSGKNNIIGVAADIAAKSDIFVMGAISDPSAMPPPSASYGGPKTYTLNGKERKVPPPAIWWPNGKDSQIAMIRADAVHIPVGNFRPELLSAGHAIIHNKIIVIDPLDSKNCAVITGSHNLGFKASYCNDDNMLIVRGNQALATAYAVHVIDLYDHYLFRARLEEDFRRRIASGDMKSLEDLPAAERHGLLVTDAKWQDKFFGKRPRSAMDYFVGVETPPRRPLPAVKQV